MKIGIVGNGYVGKAMALFGCDNIKTLIYDKESNKSKPFNTQLCHFKDCDFVFICVPTPMDPDGTCNTSIVERVCADVKEHVSSENIVLRSTVPVGTSKYLGVNYMPEFLTEANWEKDVRGCTDWVVGLLDPDKCALQRKFFDLFHLAYTADRIAWPYPVCVSTEEAELVKNTRNAFLAVKVAFFNEIEEFCRSEGLNYERVRECVTLDSRIGPSHTKVPGPDGKRGFGGTCFPKDIQSLLRQLQDAEIESYMIEAAVARNNQVDRPEKDWESKKGRAIT